MNPDDPFDDDDKPDWLDLLIGITALGTLAALIHYILQAILS